MNRALYAEWTKLRTVPSTAWSTLSIVVCTVAIGSLATMSLGAECVRTTCDTPRVTLSGVYLGQTAIAALAVLALAPEYDSQMIRTTLAAYPRRWQVLTAKAGVITLIALVAGAISVLGSLIAGRIILPGKGLGTISLGDAATMRAYAGTILYCGLIGLLSLGIATIVRHTGASVTVVLTVLYTFPIVATLVTDPLWRKWILKLSPMTAGLAIQATTNLDGQPIAPWSGLGLLTLYAVGLMLLGAVLFQRRDA